MYIVQTVTQVPIIPSIDFEPNVFSIKVKIDRRNLYTCDGCPKKILYKQNNTLTVNKVAKMKTESV